MDADNPSILACIAKKLPIVAISRDFLAFEDQFEGPDGKTRCWATLLPLSAGGAWVDYVYALVSFETEGAKKAPAKKAKGPESVPEEVEQAVVQEIEEPVAEPEPLLEETEEPIAELEEPVAEEVDEPVDELPAEPEELDTIVDQEPAVETDGQDEFEPAAPAKTAPGFSKLLDSIAGLTGFYGSQPVKVEPVVETEPEQAEEFAVAEEPAEDFLAEEPAAEPATDEFAAEEAFVDEPAEEPAETEQPAPKAAEIRASEGSLQNKLTDVRAKTNDARLAQIRANAALYEGLSAAYDFAVDAEEAPEDYLRLVEAQGLKIQLRAPMKPVVKLAFEGMCDEGTIRQLEAVLAWALKEELPRGSLLEHIEAAGGVGEILNGKKAA
jgi:hypothetical protein